jgi:hypothetical protein
MQRTRAANILYQRRLIDGQQALQPRAAKVANPYEAQGIAPSCRSYCANVIRAILMSGFKADIEWTPLNVRL